MAKSMKSKPARIPPFRPFDVPLWFEEVEREFLSKGITSDSNKFGYVVTYLYPICLPLFQNIMINPPIIGKYEKVKNNLIIMFLAISLEDPDPVSSMTNNKKFCEIGLCRMLSQMTASTSRGNDKVSMKTNNMRHGAPTVIKNAGN
uniref:DUF7041 domain-containing protein n=1 Tax=Vespula pensylvanica TaxID=30213 RepID=A0A834N8R1_VESPE|nr:hypothetical protein H0235_015702 [Vespula pensylvanica]